MNAQFCRTVSVVIALGLASSALAQEAPQVAAAVRFDTSPALAAMQQLGGEAKLRPQIHDIELDPNREGKAPENRPEAEQLQAGPAVPLMKLRDFLGVGEGFVGPQGTFDVSSVPPDTTGAAGATQYVQAVNASFAIFEKTTGQVVFGPAPVRRLWRGFGGPCERQNDGDPIVNYDKIAGRWVITQFQVSEGFSQCVAVSATPDATGAYHRYEFAYPAMNDYPKLAVWPDAYYITFNMFRGLSGARVCAYERERMLTGSAARQVCFQLSSAYWSLMPADYDGGTPPPAGTPNFLLNLGGNSRSLNYWRFRVNWSNPSASTLGVGANHTPNGTIAVAAFNDACSGGTCIPQRGTAQRLDSLGERLMQRAAYRRLTDRDALVVTHSVRSSTAPAAVRWYEIRDIAGTPTVVQQGTFSPDANSRWMASAAMDGSGNIAVGYSLSSANMFPSINVAGRRSTDPAGVLGAETVLIAGAGSQTGVSRWGDYSHMSVDPVDDCTFWYTTEYLTASGQFNWSTRIGTFRFEGCTGTGTGSLMEVLFTSTRDGNRDIYIAAADGANVRRLTNAPAADYDPAPSPDGRQILFVSERDGNPELYVMDADGSNQRRLTNNAAADTQPAWLSRAPGGAAGTLVSAAESATVANVPASASAPASDLLYQWGGEGVGIAAIGEKPQITFGCATAILDRPLPAEGEFSIPGTYIEERGGPIRRDEQPRQIAARFVGRIDDGHMSLRVTMPATNRTVAEHELWRGRPARIVRCY